MKFLVLLVGIFLISVCMTFFIFPTLIDDLIKWVGKKRHLLVIVAVRLICGSILIAGAGTTRFPTAIWWLGILFIAAGLLLLFFPADTIKRITTVWLDRSTTVIRSWVAIPMAIGIFVVYSVM
jgi:uncharacterized membrane protein